MRKGQHGVALRHVQTLFEAGALGGLTDGQLLERYTTRGGEAAELAFAALVERHGPMVLRVCRAVLARRARRPRRLPGHVPGPGPPGRLALGARLARPLAPSGGRPRRLLRPVGRGPAAAARAEGGREGGPTVGDERRDDLGPVFHEEVGRLPERYRAAIVLCYLEGLTHEQAARHLGWPIGTVQSRLARGRERLRRRLTRRGLAPSAGLLGVMLLEEPASASVPASLAGSTARSAMRFATGHMAVGVISASVVDLAEGVLKVMLLNKLKVVVALMLVSSTLVVGAVVLAQSGPAGPRGEGQGETPGRGTDRPQAEGLAGGGGSTGVRGQQGAVQEQVKLARKALRDLDLLQKGDALSRTDPQFALWERRRSRPFGPREPVRPNSSPPSKPT